MGSFKITKTKEKAPAPKKETKRSKERAIKFAEKASTFKNEAPKPQAATRGGGGQKKGGFARPASADKYHVAVVPEGEAAAPTQQPPTTHQFDFSGGGAAEDGGEYDAAPDQGLDDRDHKLSGDKDGFFGDLSKFVPKAASEYAYAKEELNTKGKGKESSDYDSRGPPMLPPTLSDADASVANGSSGDQTQTKVLWMELGLCKGLIRALGNVGFLSPTPIQAAAIPPALTGVDICARAVTGSGKTAAFVLPILHRILTTRGYKQDVCHGKRKYIRALVVVPSRELGHQCYDMTKKLLQFTSTVSIALAIGGMASQAQEAALEQAPEIVIATPGRLVDLLMNYKGPQGSIDLSGVEVVAIDEVDKMLTVTIKDQLYAILERCPEETRQTLFFSATMTKEVDEFAAELLVKPRNIEIGHVALQSQLRQQFVRVKGTGSSAFPKVEKKKKVKRAREEGAAAEGEDAAAADAKEGDDEAEDEEEEEQVTDAEPEDDKANLDGTERGAERLEHSSKIKARHLVAICKHYYPRALIFCKFRTTAHRLAVLFNAMGMSAADLQGNQKQDERFANYGAFGEGKINFLFCTDVASRGLDVPNVEVVINYDMPPTLTSYIHRVGRTARIGHKGTAVSLVDETADAELMRKIIAVSSNVNKHQVATVKRRDVSDEMLTEATLICDEAYVQVKATLATEAVDEQLQEVEKKLARATKKGETDLKEMDKLLTSTARKQWVLTKKEKQKRDDASKAAYNTEAEVAIVEEAKEELAHLDRVEQKRLQKQNLSRIKVREQKEKAGEKVKEARRADRKKEQAKLEKGLAKKEKTKKIRVAMKAKRKEKRDAETAAGKAKKRSKKGGVKKNTSKQRHKNRRVGKMKKH